MKWWQGLLVCVFTLALVAWLTKAWHTENADRAFTPPSREEKRAEAPKPAAVSKVNDEMSQPNGPGFIESLEDFRRSTEDERIHKCWEQINSKAGDDRRFRGIVTRAVASTVPGWVINREPPDMKPANTASSNFFTGLAHAGLLEDGKDGPKEKNLKEALEFLEQAHAMDPSNSAPLVYAALTAKEMGDEEKFKSLWAELEKTNRFDSFLKDAIYETFKHVQSPDDLIQASGIISTLPVPDYIALKKQFKVTPNPAVAKQLMRDGLDQENTREFGDWIAIEYAIGYDGLPQEEKGKYPTFRGLFKKKQERDPNLLDRMLTELERSCDVEALWPMVYELKSLRSAL